MISKKEKMKLMAQERERLRKLNMEKKKIELEHKRDMKRIKKEKLIEAKKRQIELKEIEEKNKQDSRRKELVINRTKRILRSTRSNKTFLICSFGGCGERMMQKYLNNFGNSRIIYSRKPPKILEHVKLCWFNGKIVKNTEDIIVIYMYRNPVESFGNIYFNSDHLKKIQVSDTRMTIKTMLNCEKDIYRLNDFFRNYTIPKNRNYKIHCVKYESFFYNIDVFNEHIGLKNYPNIYPKYYKNVRNLEGSEKLSIIYKKLIDKMDNMPPVKTV